MFDVHLLRVVLLMRSKEVKVTNGHIILLAKKLLNLPRYRHSKAQTLKFSSAWLNKWKARHHVVYEKSAKTHVTKAKTEDVDR